jgi:hypothetical protein
MSYFSTHNYLRLNDEGMRTEKETKAQRKKTERNLPPPLTSFKEHKGRFIGNFVKAKAWNFLMGGFLGVLSVAGLYWLITQTNYPIHHAWHHTAPFTNDTIRHNVRGMLEGFFGGVLGAQFAWNHFKPKYLDEPNKFETFLTHRLHFPLPNDPRPISKGQLLAAPILLTIGGAIGLVIVITIVQAFTGYGLGSDAQVPGFVGNLPSGVIEKTVYAFFESWPVKLQAFVAAFFGRYLIKGVLDDTQLWFAQRAATRRSGRQYGRIASKLLPPGYLARYNDIASITVLGYRSMPGRNRSNTSAWMLRIGSLVVLALAILGFCAINFNLPHA